MKKTFMSFCFGCRVNQAEKEKIDRKLFSLGFIRDERNPSFYIINTCAVTQKAEREVRQFMYQIRRIHPKTKIIITGCSATLWNSQNTLVPGVDYVVKNSNKDDLVNLIISHYRIGSKKYSNTKIVHDKFLDSGRLFVKIQDGCQRFCSYCIVPYLRGEPKSRKIREIVREINESHDVREVVLTAVNTEAFGLDTRETFTDLLSKVVASTRIPRISLGSVNPWSVDDKFYIFYKDYKSGGRLINYFHIPLQSGSNKILRLMKRRYTREEFEEKMNKLKSINPTAFIATDVIVGFLDETDSDFEDTYNFLEQSPISKFHIFRYSPREKTAAYYMRKNHKEPEEAVKMKRAKILAELGKKKYWQFLKKHIEYRGNALFLVRRRNGYQEVLLNNQVPAWIKTDKDRAAAIEDVRIRSFKEGQLFGTLL